MSGFIQTVFLDFVEQRLVADAEHGRGLLAVPPCVLQHLQNQLALGFARRAARDVLQRIRGRLTGGSRAIGGRRPAAGDRRPTTVLARAISFAIAASLPSITARLITFSSSRTF